MEVVHERCAGMDVSQRDVKVCVRVPASTAGRYRREVTTFGSMTVDILRLRQFLIEQRVTRVVMESTGEYWKPFFYMLEGGPFEVMLVNPRTARNIPGRKTDVSDAQWLAELAAHDLVRGSFVPPPPIRELRDLTRTYADLIRDRGRELNRLQGVLEDAGIKLAVVASDVNGVSARLMLRALAAGERDPAVLADLAKTKLRRKLDLLTQALTGRFTDHHAFMVTLHLQVIDQISAAIDQLAERIEVVIAPFRHQLTLLETIPGINHRVATVIVAETGADMTCFPSPAHLASWAGVVPGHHQSAARTKSVRTRPGNRYLKAALGIAAITAGRGEDTFLAHRYRRIKSRGGALKAVVAVEHSMLLAIHQMLEHDKPYREPHPKQRHRDPVKVLNNITRRANELGFTVRFDLIPQAG